MLDGVCDGFFQRQSHREDIPHAVFVLLHQPNNPLLDSQPFGCVAGDCNADLRGLSHVAMNSGRRLRDSLIVLLEREVRSDFPELLRY